MLQHKSGSAILRKVSHGLDVRGTYARLRRGFTPLLAIIEGEYRQEAQVQRVLGSLKTITAAAVMTGLVMSSAVSSAYAQAKEKQWKDGEYDVYSEVLKDEAAKNYTKMVTDLDAWKNKFPQSDHTDTRDSMYVGAYAAAKQPGKLVAFVGELMSKDLDALYPDPKAGPSSVIRILFNTVAVLPQLPNPTPQELAAIEKAARLLQNYNRRPEGLADGDWNNMKAQLQQAAKGTLMSVTVIPGNQALAKTPRDCATAETVFTKALSEYPENAFIAYQLGVALNCQARANAGKMEEYGPRAIYSFVRAVVLDPTLGGTQDGKKVTDYVVNAYNNYHGDSEGLEALKTQAKSSPLPPAGFTIETATKVAERKQKEFNEKYPQLAIWLGIKGQLASPEGNNYFSGTMKDAKVPKLKGMLVDAQPACRSKSLLVSVPEPNQTNAPTVITLKLDTALTGKPETGVEIEWEGVPSAFTQDPFMLTMDIQDNKTDLTGVKTTPCTAAPAKAPAGKKGPAAKKK